VRKTDIALTKNRL